MRKVIVLVCMIAAMALCVCGTAGADGGDVCGHEFDENGCCSICGYQCEHEHLQTEDIRLTYQYVWMSMQQHRMRFTRTTRSYCADCGFSEERTIEGSEETEDHFDYDNGGVCDACLRPLEESTDWEVNGNTLVITGQGNIQNYSSGATTPWAPYRNTVKRIILDGCITGIGDYAFAGFAHDVRIEFNQWQQPEISETAFTGTDGAVCRYYTEENWVGGNYGGTNISWIKLPVRVPDGEAGITGKEILGLSYTQDGWRIHTEDEAGIRDVPVTAEQAKEASYDKHLGISFYAVPASAEDQSVYGDWSQVSHITMENGCAGALNIALGEDDVLRYVTMSSADSTLTISDPREAGLYHIEVSNGTLTYNGNVESIRLYKGDGDPHTVSINGDAGSITFYGPTSDNAYNGSLYVSGTIGSGFVWGEGEIDIPGAGTTPIEGAVISHFQNVHQEEAVILNGELTVNETEPVTVSTDMYSFDYCFDGSADELKTHLTLYPKAEYYDTIGNEPINLHNLNIGTDDIVWGDSTSIDFQTAAAGGYIELNGGTDENGDIIGVSRVDIRSGQVKINCPAGAVIIANRQYETDGVDLVIRSDVNLLIIEAVKLGTISIDGEGNVHEGIWLRHNFANRYFGPVSTAGALYSGGTLRTMSWREGQQIRAELPADEDVTDAAGLSGNQHAAADVRDSSAAELSSDEQDALEDFLAEHEGAAAAIFDAMIFSYTEDAEGSILPGGAITNLNSTVEFKVSNSTGDECYIVRLHDEGNGMTAAQLTEPTDAAEIPFRSDLFSKYAIIAKNWTAAEEWTEWTFGEVGEGIDREWVLHITGSGEMPDYSSPVQTPWYAEAAGHENIRIVIDESVTKVGNKAFGNLGGTVRVDFRGETMPTVSTTAFSGTTARCRYYYENESWTAGINGRNDAKWIYLPVYEEDTPGRWPINFGYPNTGTSTLSWYLQNSQGDIPLTTEQAEELSYKCRELNFDIMPRMSDTKLYETGNVPWHATFGAGCDGEYNLNASNGANTLERLDINAPKMKLTINRSTADKPMEFAEIKSGTVGITGDVAILSLRNSNDATACSVTISGDVGEMDFYNASTGDNAYSGNAEIIGTIGQGYEYDNGTMYIPGIGNSVPLNSFVAKRFSDLTRTAAEGLLIDHGVLTLQSGEYEAGGSTDIEDYRLEYQFIDDTMDEYDRTVLTLTPKSGGQGIDIDILEQKPTFSPADIIWGSDTDIHIGCWDPRTPKSITLGNGGEGQGFNSLFINSTCGTINLNCPVNQLEVYQSINSTNTLKLNINSKVENTATLSLRGNGNTVKLGENGWLAGGIQYMKPLTSTRELPAIRGMHDPLIADGRLTVMSSKAGESLESILPGDSALATAAGMTAVMDISESTEPLSGDELETLEKSLQIGNDEVVEVFNVTVTGYDAEENPTQLDKLNGCAVQMAIKNTTGEEVYVARLHEENGQRTATAVSETTAGDVVWFASDLFSKYVLVKPDNSIDPSTLLTLRLPDSLTRIEEYAFAGGIFEAVIIPDGCIYIGEHAFENCGELVYISYPASYESGEIEIKESAFDGCRKIKVAIRDNDAGQ